MTTTYEREATVYFMVNVHVEDSEQLRADCDYEREGERRHHLHHEHGVPGKKIN
jgi:hypothetical protein